eukprot:3075320-Rhodomonas_salina.2
MFTPPRTTGIEAESVVFICCGSWPPLGEVGRPIASWSLALTTRCTKTLLLSVSMPSAATVGSQSMPVDQRQASDTGNNHTINECRCASCGVRTERDVEGHEVVRH